MRTGLQWLGRVPLSNSCHLEGAMLFNCACGGAIFVTAMILQNLGETKIVIGDGFVLTTLREAKSQQWQHQRQVPCSPDHTCCWRESINETICASDIASNTHQHCIREFTHLSTELPQLSPSSQRWPSGTSRWGTLYLRTHAYTGHATCHKFLHFPFFCKYIIIDVINF